MENNTVFNVKNRSAGVVGYNIPEEKIRREFAPGETKKISWYELEKLSFQPGGTRLMEEYLLIYNDKAVSELNLRAEPEYYMNETDVVKLIKEGNLDEWLDALDFAPAGVMDLIKQLSVTIPLSDYNKRKTLKEKTGFDVDAAIKNWQAEQEVDKKAVAEAPKRRVSKANEEPAQPARRTAGKYKIVNTQKEN